MKICPHGKEMCIYCLIEMDQDNVEILNYLKKVPANSEQAEIWRQQLIRRLQNKL